MASNIINFFFIFCLTWWTVIFCVLPFGVKKDENPEFKGNATAAPKNAYIKIKFLVTTIITFILTLIIQSYWKDIFPINN